MSNNPTIKISDERRAQFRQIAQNLGGINTSEVLGNLMRLAEIEGFVDRGIPGVKIDTVRDGVAVTIEDQKTVNFSFRQAARLAKEIETFLDKENEPKTTIRHGSGDKPNYCVERRGQGFVICIPADAPPKIFDRGLTRDFVRYVREAIAAASKGAA